MSYTKSVVLPVSPDEAFTLITDPERLRRWQTVSAYVDLRTGGEYRWTITPGQVATGTFKEIEPGRRLVFGWGWEGNPELGPDASTVTVTIEPTSEGTRVTLEHAGLTDRLESLHAQGWDHYLGRLEEMAATGDAGPDDFAWTADVSQPAVIADAALAAIQPVLRGLDDDDLDKPTPCADFTCADLVEHLTMSLVRLGAMAGVTVTEPGQGSIEHRVSTVAAPTIDAWRAVDLSGTVPGPGGAELPASFAASILPVELILHGWDLARASGQDLQVRDDVVACLRELAEVFVPSARTNGSFGEEVEPAADANPMDRLAAYAGRRPLVAA
ncbi:MAG: TIGR03086 family metal-binding protein [Actinomycetota bacterium]|nr:TIGR03086 family metal-binding protein [Actinomycetota bacterium]